MGLFQNMKERIGRPRGKTMETMVFGTRLLETMKGLPLTIIEDTCSSYPPYEQLPAGVTLRVNGLMWLEPDAGPERVMVHFVLDEHDDSEDLALTLAEVFEVTNISDFIEVVYRGARASEASPLTA